MKRNVELHLLNHFVCSLFVRFHELRWERIQTHQQTDGRHIGAEPCVTWLLTVAGQKVCACARMYFDQMSEHMVTL